MVDQHSAMAILLKNLIRVFLFCLLITVEIAETSSHDDQCKESSCDGIHGPFIRFPFRLKGRQPQWCGYNDSSWYELYCTDTNQTVLELPFSLKTIVKTINYTSKIITVSYPEFCLHKQIPNFNISSSPFQFNDEFGLSQYALFNCSGTSHKNTYYRYDNILTSGNFSCLNVPGFEVIAVKSISSIILAPLLSCTRIQDLVLLPNSLFNNNVDASLNWFQPDCRNCERKGGQCKANRDTSQQEFECTGIVKGMVSSIYFHKEIMMLYSLRFTMSDTSVKKIAGLSKRKVIAGMLFKAPSCLA